MAALGIRFQQLTLVALAPLVAILFWSRIADPVNVPKATLAAVVALMLVVVSLIRTAATRRLTWPLAPAAWAASAFAAALFIATVTSDVPGASFAGTVGRSDGLLLYGACVVLFLVGVRVLDVAAVTWLLYGVLIGGTLAGGYGLLQQAGVDPIGWADVGISPVIGAFGNPDFESGYLGIVVPVAGWGALRRSWPAAWRLTSLALALMCLLVIWWTSAIQGFLAGAAGLVILGIAVLLDRGGPSARRGLWVVAAAVTVLVVGATALLAGVGPGERLLSAGNVTVRKWYWGSALRMWQHHPLTGVGLDRYGAQYRSVRPSAAAAASNYSDAAHSVPLHFLATGGLLLAVSYLAIVVLVAWSLVQGLRRTQGEERLLVGAVGGAWVAYQVQSLVSIDQPGLAVTHWLLAAGVVVAAGQLRFHERLLPGAVQPRVRKGRAAPLPSSPPLVWSGATIAVCALSGVLALVGLWFAIKPLRASFDSRGAALALAEGKGNLALDRLDAATRQAPYEGTYWLQRGRFFEQVKQPALAGASYASGLRHDAQAYDLLIAGAVLAKAQGDTGTLDRYSRRLDAIDPSGGWRTRLGG